PLARCDTTLTITEHRHPCYLPPGNNCRQAPHPAMELCRAWCPCDGDCSMLVQGEPELGRVCILGLRSTPHACPDRGNCHRLGCGPPRVPAARQHRHGHLRGLCPLPMLGAATNGAPSASTAYSRQAGRKTS